MPTPRTTRLLTHRHPMRVVTRRTGLSAELLRVWERRYRVVTPARTHTGRRLYSDAEIERLHLLYQATLGGRSIGLIASLPIADLRDLLRQDANDGPERAGILRTAPSVVADASPADSFVRECLAAVERFDQDALSAVLHRASIALPAILFLDNVIAKLHGQVSARLRLGTLRPVDDRLTATVVRRVLERMMVPAPASAPKLLVATLTGETQELGALITAAAAASQGWSVTWLGAGFTADDIFDAAKKLRARAIALSLIHPIGDVAVSRELKRLRSLLPRKVEIIAGGAASAGHAALFDEIGATR